MELYYAEPGNIASEETEFDAFESQHILRARRKRKGDSIYFTDGKGRLYSGIIHSQKPVVTVRHELVRKTENPPVASALAVGFIKPQRLDFLIEKATELGINRFMLINSRYANYSSKNTDRWIKICRQAIKQSQRLFLPEIIVFDHFENFLLEHGTIDEKYIAEQSAPAGPAEVMAGKPGMGDHSLLFAIGPEGGFASEEIDQARENGFTPVNLGDFRLRTETAALVAAMIINLRN